MARVRGGNHVSPADPLLLEIVGNLPVPHALPLTGRSAAREGSRRAALARIAGRLGLRGACGLQRRRRQGNRARLGSLRRARGCRGPRRRPSSRRGRRRSRGCGPVVGRAPARSHGRERACGGDRRVGAGGARRHRARAQDHVGGSRSGRGAEVPRTASARTGLAPASRSAGLRLEARSWRRSVRVREPRAADEGFDERSWLARQGIHVVLRGGAWHEIGRRGGVAGVGDRVRDGIERAVGRGTAGVRRALVLGVVLGEDEGLPARVRDDFRASGLYHLLAVSGQNVAFIAIGIFGLGWLLRLPRVARELATLAGIGVYVLAVGWQPSVIRAGVAGALVSLAWLAARPRDRWHFLALGALVLLVWAPTSVLEPGFQLSFAAVAGIFVGVPRVRDRLEGYPIPTRLAEGLGLAVVCGVVTAPIVLVQFGQAPRLHGSGKRPCGAGHAARTRVGPPGGRRRSLRSRRSGSARLACGMGSSVARARRTARRVASGRADRASRSGRARGCSWQLAGLLFVRHESGWAGGRRRRQSSAGALLLGAAVLWEVRPAPAWQQPAGLRVTFLDVGQGDSALLETPSARVLVDQGPPEANVAGQLARMGIRLALCARADPPAARSRRRCRRRPPAAPRGSRARSAALRRPARTARRLSPPRASGASPFGSCERGRSSRSADSSSACCGRRTPGSPSEDPNLNAVVLVATYGETDVFLPADAESDVTVTASAPAGRGDEGRPPWFRRSGARRRAARAPTAYRGHLVRPKQRLRPSAPRDACRARCAYPALPSTEPTRMAESSSSPTGGSFASALTGRR